MPMQEDRPPREVREPRLFGLIPRERAYLILMGVCLLLIVLAWTLIWRTRPSRPSPCPR